ncbi:hypothetical protein MICAE_690017 [Microcystis aeruginosa PCC 9806]|uniref:Uncharacterized protein n=1 Tax=Microcystis aeruginosa PCC 9806 TaxID=1160282 RepID=I4H1J5_MICAE|nr:hypothetical protein MICAE_690017 [Microcystis aeruginosa PCC 9806]
MEPEELEGLRRANREVLDEAWIRGEPDCQTILEGATNQPRHLRNINQ